MRDFKSNTIPVDINPHIIILSMTKKATDFSSSGTNMWSFGF